MPHFDFGNRLLLILGDIGQLATSLLALVRSSNIEMPIFVDLFRVARFLTLDLVDCFLRSSELKAF